VMHASLAGAGAAFPNPARADVDPGDVGGGEMFAQCKDLIAACATEGHEMVARAIADPLSRQGEQFRMTVRPGMT